VDFNGVIGPNGGRKTTLLKVILGLIKPSAGKIVFNSDLVDETVSAIFQDCNGD